MVFPLIGKTMVMLKMKEKIDRATHVDSPILIYGEPGTGKQLVAQTVHQQSDRADGPFVMVTSDHFQEAFDNCLSCSTQRFSEEGCMNFEEGCTDFEAARGGVLFIDEITRFPSTCQAKLLRSIEQRKSKRASRERELSDFRLVVSTNKPPQESVEQNTLREDLYYQLAIITIQVPALRERKEDIPLLVHHFLERLCTEQDLPIPSVESDLMEKMVEYPWPGNVEQLQGCLAEMLEADPPKTTLSEQDFHLQVTQ